MAMAEEDVTVAIPRFGITPLHTKILFNRMNQTATTTRPRLCGSQKRNVTACHHPCIQLQGTKHNTSSRCDRHPQECWTPTTRHEYLLGHTKENKTFPCAVLPISSRGTRPRGLPFNATYVEVSFTSRYTLSSYRRVVVIPLIAQLSCWSVIHLTNSILVDLLD
jgi:hypothetical protein